MLKLALQKIVSFICTCEGQIILFKLGLSNPYLVPPPLVPCPPACRARKAHKPAHALDCAQTMPVLKGQARWVNR